MTRADSGQDAPAVRITLVSLTLAAERVHMLAETGEIEVDDLPSAAIPPTLKKVN